MENIVRASVWIVSSNPNFIASVLVPLHVKCDFTFQALLWRDELWRSERLPLISIISGGPAVNPKTRKTRQRSSSVTYQLVLIGRDSGEDGLHKNEGAELLRLEVEQRGRVVLLLDDVDPWLVLVHGVQDYLRRHDDNHRWGEFSSVWGLSSFTHTHTTTWQLNTHV